jgi:hypothetical protein
MVIESQPNSKQNNGTGTRRGIKREIEQPRERVVLTT